MGGFSYGDIIVIGAIAVFILLRYRAMLGENSGRDEATRSKPVALSEYERVIQLPAARLITAPEKKDDTAQYGALAERFTAMRAIDKDFTPDEFLAGARTAYEMVINAFSHADRDTLKMLLSPAMYKSFDASLTDAKTANRIAETTLVSLQKAEFIDAKLSGTTATLTVDFLSEQIHLIRNSDGTILEGNPSLQEHVEDRWIFSRNLASSNPNWTVIET